MEKYQDIISKLKTKGVVFDSGMSPKEINEIEKLYNIHFPCELKSFYSIGIPVSSGFYNWRNTNEENTQLIKNILKSPIKGLKSDLEAGDFWCEDWGGKPVVLEEAENRLLMYYNDAPKMIPIYSHRYMPYIPKVTEIPVFSIMQSDIVLYGENLISYFEVEFGLKKYNDILQANFRHIDFWSNLL